MKKILWILGGILVLIIAAGASFEGGMAYQRNQTSQIRNAFFRSRGIATGNGGFTASGSDGQGRGFFGGGATGQVKSINGNVLTLSTAQSVVTVNLSGTTQIEKTTSGVTTDIQPGERVIVSGTRDSSGNIAASQVLILGTAPTNPTPTP